MAQPSITSGDESGDCQLLHRRALQLGDSGHPPHADDDSGSPTIPGGQALLQVTEVVTTGGVAVASAGSQGLEQ